MGLGLPLLVVLTCGATEVRTVLVGAGLLDAVLVDVGRGVVLRDAVLEDDAFLVAIS